MELILYVIMGIMIGTLIGIVSVKLFMSKPSVDYKELIKQSEQRLEIAKKHGEELDKMLEEMKKQSGGGMVDASQILGAVTGFTGKETPFKVVRFHT